MLILAIDSATPVAGVALVNDDNLIREEFINYKLTHSEILMPIVDEVLLGCELSLADVDALAVTMGPGSFTGLRIGMAAVKGLSLAADLPVIGISTLEVIAHNIAYSNTLVCSLLNARRQEVYAACYDNRGCYPQRLSEEMACPPEALARQAIGLCDELGFNGITLLGDGYAPYRDLFKLELGERLRVVPSHLMLPRAAALASLAMVKATRDEYENAVNMRPRYIRLSEAERKLGKGEV